MWGEKRPSRTVERGGTGGGGFKEEESDTEKKEREKNRESEKERENRTGREFTMMMRRGGGRRRRRWRRFDSGRIGDRYSESLNAGGGDIEFHGGGGGDGIQWIPFKGRKNEIDPINGFGYYNDKLFQIGRAHV